MSSFIINVAEAKRRFSELMNEVVYHKKSFLIARRGKPLVGLVPASEIKTTAPTSPLRGFLALVGTWGEFNDLDEVIEKIYQQRSEDKPRSVPPLEE